MIGILPEALAVGGKFVQINADFRNALIIFSAFTDEALTAEEKAYICLKRLYKEKIPKAALEEAIKKAYWFLDGGDMPKSKPTEIKMLDWEHDEAIIMPAVSKTIGVVDVRSLPFLHWWSFLGAFGEVGEGLFSQIVHIRQKMGKGEKLNDAEKEFCRKNEELVMLRTAEEKAEIAETEDFVNKLLAKE